MIASRLNYLGENVLGEKEKLLIIQKWRLEKALVEEANSGQLLKSVSTAIDIYSRMLTEMLELRKNLGLGVNLVEKGELPVSEEPSKWMLRFLKNGFLKDEVKGWWREAVEKNIRMREELEIEEKGIPFIDKPPAKSVENPSAKSSKKILRTEPLKIGEA